LEVKIQQGGPQVNHTQLLLAGRLVDRLTALGQGLHPKDRLYPKDRNVTKAYMVQSINYTVGMDLTH